MKTAEEQLGQLLIMIGCDLPLEEVRKESEEQFTQLLQFIKQIQLDAFKAGMTEATKHIGVGRIAQQDIEAILSARDNLINYDQHPTTTSHCKTAVGED